MLYLILKRFIDILGSLVGIILFSPIMLVTAVYIKVVSPDGPIFVHPNSRVGRNGREFKMYKFRTMIPNAQEWLKAQPELYKKYQENGYKLDPDPRWLHGAQLIRKYSIDEMPQFFNVLLGSMSIVGPRAYFGFELKEQLQRYPQTENSIKTTLTIKPGITGPWQVGGRSAVGFVERINIDAAYASTRSIVYDLVIVIKTPLAVVSGKGAV